MARMRCALAGPSCESLASVVSVLGEGVSAGTPREAAAADVVVIAVPAVAWIANSLGRSLATTSSSFGRRHGFGSIATFRDFQERVPISTYEDLEPYITAEMQGQPNQLTKDPPVLFTTTSGTTGNRKYIPMTREGKQAKGHAPVAFPSGPSPDTPTGQCPDRSGRCTPHPMGCSPSRTTRPSTPRCCGWPRARTSAVSPPSTPAPFCSSATGSPTMASRSSVTSTMGHSPLSSRCLKTFETRCICAPTPSGPSTSSRRPSAAVGVAARAGLA
jgi:hypothetical protein